MKIQENLEPKKVFSYFEKICSIPHGSTNTKMISDYLVSFAEDHGLSYIQDEENNVIIYKPATTGKEYKESDAVILQGHIDMVCEKEADCDIDFEKDGLRLQIKDGYIEADGTTLGGDDGIAVAYMLAILDSDDIPHPPLECVFTVDEEIGMLGAAAMDMSVLKGRKLLNIDSEEEGYLLVSCAGGETVTMHFPVVRRGAQGERYILSISGLIGGHSGVDIDKGRANADILLGKLLQAMLYADDSLRIVKVEGGFKDNAIPVASQAEIVTKRREVLYSFLQSDTVRELTEMYKESDPDLTISLVSKKEKASEEVLYPFDEMVNLTFLMAYSNIPDGVQMMSDKIEGLVQTSLNLGIMNTSADEVTMSFSVRSSVNKEKEELVNELELIARSAGGTITRSGAYPAWEFNDNSILQGVMTETYQEMYHKPMVVQAIHAGVECGLFSDALTGLDAVSFGPDILDIHTPRERLNIESVARVWDYIKVVLEKLS